MATGRALLGAPRDLVGTFTSRYSEFDRYWLFGFLVSEGASFDVDLIGEPVLDRTALGVARALAATKFREQVGKTGLRCERVSAASCRVDIGRPMAGVVDGRGRQGVLVSVTAKAELDNGRRFEAAHESFAAPHNSRVERPSARVSR